MTRGIVFDLDGTLVDSAVVCLEILNDMLAERSSARTIHPAFARSWMSVGGARMVAALLGDDCGDPEAEIAEFRRRYADRPTPRASLYPGVRDGLAALSAAGYRLAICSNKPRGLCDKVLAELRIDHRFDAVIGARAGLRAKPAPDLLDVTLAQLGLDAAECAFVGDSEIDHALAATAGMRFHFMTYGYAAPGWSADGFARHDRFADLVATLLPRRQAGAA